MRPVRLPYVALAVARLLIYPTIVGSVPSLVLASLLCSPPLRRWPRLLISAAAAVLAVACVLQALALAAYDVGGVKRGFVVQGRVFRDTCRAGFETPASTYIRGEGFAFYRILGRQSTLVRDRL
ncbi:hypothetical protein BHE74_00018853 [Ensete ventricosum]|nr:hypothetical protein BHE74_00018853 [Ensete ventricosum]